MNPLYIDSREVTEHPEIPDVIGIDHAILLLPAGDYVFLDFENKPVGIERCKITNFIQKLQSGELEDQLYKCVNMFPTVVVLIEDIYDNFDGLLATYKATKRGYFRSYIYTRTMYKAIKSAELDLSRMGMEVVYSPNFECSMETVRLLYANRTKPPESHTLFSKIRKPSMPVKMSANPAVPKLLALCPRMPEKVAIALIYKYDTIWNILLRGDKELMEIAGMGRGLIKNLREAVGMEHID